MNDLSVRFETDEGPIQAVDRVSFSLARREVLGIVGESGCGKSVTCMSLVRLLPETARVSGSVMFEGQDLLALGARRLRRVRGREIAYVFQEPMSFLNPVFTVGDQIGEAVRRHLGSRVAQRAGGRWSCSSSYTSPLPRDASTSIRTSSPAGCASGW